MKMFVRRLVFLFCCGLLAGCATTRTQVAEPGRSLKEVRRYFVEKNLKDNHAVAERIARALRARGFEAESGPITMLSPGAQAVIVYEDRWTWDFADHMVYLKIGARDPKAVFPYLAVSYRDRVSFSTQVDEVIGRLVDELLAAGVK